MATVKSQEDICILVEDRILELGTKEWRDPMAEILTSIGLEQLVTSFRVNMVGPREVQNLGNEAFQLLGISDVEDIIRLKQACRNYMTFTAVDDASQCVSTAVRKPGYVVVTEDKLLVTDNYACNLLLYSRRGGKLLSSHRLESIPIGVCLISKTEVAVCLSDSSKIVILSFKHMDDVKLVKTLDVWTVFYECHSVTKLNTDELVVSGVKYDGMMLYWGVVSITDGRLDSSHIICTGNKSNRTHLAIKENTVYISCWTRDFTTNGVYAYDIFNPQTQKFLYQHQELKNPHSIMAGRDSVFVSDLGSKRIHQLTNSGQLVTIHTVSSMPHEIFYDDQHGVLYTTSILSNVITLYRVEYLHQPGVPIEILKMDDRSIQLFEEALKDGKETVHSIRIMVVGHMGVGKTTLVKRLLGEEVNISERRSTEGIDVYVNCCDVSLSTHEWTRRTIDSGQGYRLQRIARVLKEQKSIKAYKEQSINRHGEKTSKNLDGNHVAQEDKDTDVLYHRSSQQDAGQDLVSITRQQKEPLAHQQEETPSYLVQRKSTHSETSTITMLKLLKENVNKLESAGETSLMTIWDFAGQYAFYTTHQTFLTRRAIYLLVSDVSGHVTDLVADECYFDSEGIMKRKVHELNEVWLNSIHSCASSPESGSPPVILVGTHVDKISQADRHQVCERYFREIRSYLKDKPTRFHLIDEGFAIDNTIVDRKLEDLKRKIVEVASQQQYWGEEIPARWLPLEQELMSLKAFGMKGISREEVERINKEGTVKIESSEELDLFLRYLHETGTIIYFSIKELRENILLDPTWLIDALKSLINAQPDLPETAADNGTRPGSLADSVLTQKWSDFKRKGMLSSELVDAVWTKEKYPELHAYKRHMLLIMEQLNIIAKPRAFSEIGEKIVENYFLTPCMLRQESPREIISPEHDPQMVSTPVLCCVFTGKILPPPIFHRLIAACVTRWPVAKKKETSENLIFCGCCIFDLDLFHRLTLHCKNHIVFARITRRVVDEVNTPDARLCARVRKFITLNLSKITSYLGQNLKYELCTWWSPSQVVSEDGSAPPFQMWFADEGYDSNAPIMPEHMNHARLCVALVTVCANALREILLTHVPAPYTNIYHAIRANKANLTNKTRRRQMQNALLLSDQCQLVFPDPFGRYVASMDQFDISVLYILIRNVSTVPASMMNWGIDPIDQPFRDRSLGASVERIRSYRNRIGHSMDGKMNKQDFDDYWNKIDAVLDDIEHALGRQGYRVQLEKQKRQVISVYEAC